jgi:tetratricopeptide (TPR) repeat protein/tRNA A-37 threonylcarbamoyl transferase component Bud32
MSEGSEDPASIGPFVVHSKLGEGAMGVVYAGYDVGLDRKVALKLVRRQLLDKPAVRERMIREAQAMARLSSPYVVQVYQVGPHRDGIYVAMEFVDGLGFGGWLKAARRSWQLVLRTLCDAGRGLAAAHAAGLVHRDFKPDNVLVDASGRARVLDFGLVQSDNGAAGGGDTDELTRSTSGIDDTMHSSGVITGEMDRSNVHWSVRLTQFGRAVGTPAYMSPEQHFGDPVGTFSDQFSFAITLYEALYGVRPFAGDSWDSLKAQVRRGVVPPPPPESRVPAWVFKVLQRGLAIEPDQRWPTMDAMVDALEADPGRARRRAAGVAALLGVASAVSYAVALSREPVAVDRCVGAAQELAGVWDAGRKAEVAAAFAATHASFAADVRERVESRLDGYAGAWVDEHVEICEANHAGRQTGHLLDLRMACLGRHRSRMAALVEVLASADQAVVENAVQAVAALPSVAACADAAALLAVAPPDDPQTAQRVDQLRRQLERAEALEGTGRYDQGLELALKVDIEAKALGYAPLAAEAALGAGGLLMAVGRLDEAQEALGRAVTLGVVSDMHALAATAAAKRIFVLGNEGLRRHDEALAAELFVGALIDRANDRDGRLAALLHNNLGVVQQTRRAFDAAGAEYERAIAAFRKLGDEDDPLLAVTYHNLGNMYLDQGRGEPARVNYTHARLLFTRLLGEHHPLVAHPLAGIGDVDVAAGAWAAAIASHEQALALMEAAYGPDHYFVLQPLAGLGRAYAGLGQSEQARAHFQRAIVIADRLQVVHQYVAVSLEGLGALAEQAGRISEARGLFERAVEVYEASAGKDSGLQAPALVRAGELAAQAGEHAAATQWFERVLALSAETKPGVRSAAALGLAKLLARRPEATARVCDLLAEAKLSPDGPGPQRAEASALAARRCAVDRPRSG